MARTARTFTWTTIDQPGEFFRVANGYLIEDGDGFERVWRMDREDGERVWVTLVETRYA